MLQTWASGFTRTELYVANLGLRIYKERTICGKPGPQDLQRENYMWQTWASGFPLLSLIFKERTVCGKTGLQG